jgi:hypothetical protein
LYLKNTLLLIKMKAILPIIRKFGRNNEYMINLTKCNHIYLDQKDKTIYFTMDTNKTHQFIFDKYEDALNEMKIVENTLNEYYAESKEQK